MNTCTFLVPSFRGGETCGAEAPYVCEVCEHPVCEAHLDGQERLCVCLSCSPESPMANPVLIEKTLFALLAEYNGEDEWAAQNDVTVETFKEAGILTRDRGLVLTIGRQKFQITIVEA